MYIRLTDGKNINSRLPNKEYNGSIYIRTGFIPGVFDQVSFRSFCRRNGVRMYGKYEYSEPSCFYSFVYLLLLLRLKSGVRAHFLLYRIIKKTGMSNRREI